MLGINKVIIHSMILKGIGTPPICMRHDQKKGKAETKKIAALIDSVIL
jgi:hypothetical protein